MHSESEYEENFRKAVQGLPSSLNIYIEKENDNKEYKDCWKLRFKILIDVPVGSSFPSKVPLTLYINETYPFCEYAIFPDDNSIRGYDHQDSQTGKLCLWPDSKIGFDENRLWRIIYSAKKWLEAAAKGTLISKEEPYEIPDFSWHGFQDFKLPRILFNEGKNDFNDWNRYFSKHGICDIGSVANDAILFIQRFKSSNTTIHEYEWGTAFSNKRTILNAIWILLNNEPLAIRRQPCRTWGELKTYLSKNKIELRSLFVDNYKKIKPCGNEFYLVLIGFPINDKNKDQSSEIHWQPLLIRRWDILDKEEVPGFRSGHVPADILFARCAKTILFKDNESIFWAKSTNICFNRFFGRGMLGEKINKLRIGLIGFGSIGSHVANILVRQGINELILFDSDKIEAGNLCRHISDLNALDSNKVKDAVARLSAINPHLKIRFHDQRVPLNEKEDSWKDLLSCDLLIDCSASELVLNWLSDIGEKNNKRVVRIYITYQSKYLCMFGNGKGASLIDSHYKIMSSAEKKENIIPKDFFESPSEVLLEGAGCWHPTFPARLDKILSLTSFAIQRLDSKFQDDRDDAWGVVVGYQGEEKFGGKPFINCFFEEYL